MEIQQNKVREIPREVGIISQKLTTLQDEVKLLEDSCSPALRKIDDTIAVQEAPKSCMTTMLGNDLLTFGDRIECVIRDIKDIRGRLEL